MKKLMLGVLVLIPIVILLIVQAVSIVVSSRTHIGVEEIAFDKTEIEMQFGNGVFDFNDYVKVSVLPERATDKTVTWTITDLDCLDPDYSERLKNYEQNGDKEDYTGEIVLPPAAMVDDDGNIVQSNTTGNFRLFSYCSFYVEAQAETMKVRCLVYVTGFTVEKISLVGVNSVNVGESVLLNAAYFPFDSIITDTIWTSSDPEVLSVDGNGGITGIKEGTATITAQAISPGMVDYVESNAFFVTVEKGASAFGSKVLVHEDFVSLSSLGLTMENIDTLINATTVFQEGDTVLQFINTAQAAVVTTKQNGSVTLTKCGENEIKIRNAELYNYDAESENNFVLAVGELPLILSAEWLSNQRDGQPENVIWNSDRSAVASVDKNGVVTGLKRGIVKITATYGEGVGASQASVFILVENKVSSLLLNYTDSSLAVGLARETVFASSKYIDGSYSAMEANSLTVLPIRPKAPTDQTELDAYLDSFVFEVFEKDGAALNATDKAVFERNRLIFVPDKITKRATLVVRVSAKYPKYDILKEFTVKEFALNVTDGVSVGSYADLVAASTSGKEICFVGDVKMNDGDTTPFSSYWQGTIRLDESLWGNNFMYSAAHKQMYDYSTMLEIENDNVTVSNIRLRVNEVGNEITDANGNKGLTGKGIGTGCFTYGSGRMLKNLRLEYSLIENGMGCLSLWASEIDIEGCIFRNTSGVAVYVSTERAGDRISYVYLTVTNCVMSNVVGTGFSFQYSGYSKTGDAQSIERAKADVAAGRNTTFTQKGFLDIYNWQSIDIMSLINLDSLGEEFSGTINAIARNEFASNDAFKPFFSRYNGVDYFHMGFLSNGLTEPTYLEPQLEDSRFSMITTEVVSIKLFREAPPVKFWAYRGNETSITPGKTYSINAKLIERLHGEY